MQQPPDERDPDQLTIPVFPQALEPTRGMDSLGPSRSLPARAVAAREASPLVVLVAALGILAAFALFTLPASPSAQNARSLLAQALGQLSRQGLDLHDVKCPRELTLTAGEQFSCSARASGATLRIELTAAASRTQGPVDVLQARVEGAVGVADVAKLAASRYGAGAVITCPHRYWVIRPDAHESCTLRLGAQSGSLTVRSGATPGEFALEAPWLDLRHASVE
ncbi:MAG TPA: DUF4333 domain-containing protein [Polyangiales bacterium]|nr:DUF4333 domain-containing protein [Polyangiales bacterium]